LKNKPRWNERKCCPFRENSETHKPLGRNEMQEKREGF